MKEEEEGRLAGDMPRGGRWRFEGQVRGRSSIILVSRREGREMSVIKFNKEKKKDVEEEEEGQKREGIGAEHLAVGLAVR